ncbi:hypothetical protein ACEQ8H_005854 [Pleosporales sp. CAS-2024a]
MSTSISPALESFMPLLNRRFPSLFVPDKVRTLLGAMHEFRAYMDELITREKARKKDVPSDDNVGAGAGAGSAGNNKTLNLIQTLVLANEPDAHGQTQLSDSELRGNIFVFTVGGLESTSATLTYALALMALHEDVQAWSAFAR